MEGNLVWWLIGGLGAGIAVFFLLIVALNVSLLGSAAVALVPVVVVVAYIFLLRQGRPPGYDRDIAESLLVGCGFGPEPGNQDAGRHPASED